MYKRQGDSPRKLQLQPTTTAGWKMIIEDELKDADEPPHPRVHG